MAGKINHTNDSKIKIRGRIKNLEERVAPIEKQLSNWEKKTQGAL